MVLCWLTVIGACLVTAKANTDCDNSCVLDGIRESAGLPALAAAVVRDDDFTGAVSGLRKLGSDIQVEQDDKFHLGSLTKAMTATLIGLLVDQGRLSWETTIPEALSDLQDSIAPGHRNTTIAMLASHRSGIVDDIMSDKELWLSLRDPLLSPVEGRSIVINRILDRDPASAPGEWVYDNTNYVILGRVVENYMEGQLSWEESMEKHLFEPLGMDCGFGTPPESSETSIDNPWGHLVDSLSDPPIPADGPLIQRDNPRALGPAATVHCDMKSYSMFTNTHLQGHLGHSTALSISSETFKYLHTPYPPTPDSPQAYTPGAWFYVDGSETPWTKGPFLNHAGSNTMHYAETDIVFGLRETRMSFTNVGNSLEGGNAPAGNASTEVFRAISSGQLFKPEDDKTDISSQANVKADSHIGRLLR